MKKTIDTYDIRPHIRVSHVTSFKRLMLLLFATWGCLVLMGLHQVACAADTRGLRVVAKDPASGQSGEVKLYNKSYAVIIGIDKYPNLPQDRQLAYAVKDAKGIEQVLKQQYKFDKIITLYDQQATKSRILELLTDELPTQMGEEDSLFIFWAGHGNQEKKSDGDLGYLIPFDGKMGKLTTVITMDEIKNTISKAVPAKHVFYVFDACYSGLLTTRAVDTKSRRDLAYLKEITRERVRQVLTAGGKGQEVLDSGRNGHSVFTGRLIEVLEAKGDFVTANEIQAIIREKVNGDARARGHKQTPAYDAISGSGDYVFVPSREFQYAEKQAELDRIRSVADKTKQENEKLKKQMADDEAIIAAAIKAGDEVKKQTAELELKRKQGLQKLAEERLTEQQYQQRRTEQEAVELKNRDAERQRIQTEVRQNQLKLQDAEQRRAREQVQQEESYKRQKAEEERHNAELRRQGEEKRKKALEAVQAALSVEAAEEQINKANAEIAAINREFDTEQARQKAAADKRLADKKARLKVDYDKRMLELKKQPIVVITRPVIPPRDEEFETLAAYNARVKKVEDDYKQRLSEAKSVGTNALRAEGELYNNAIAKAEKEHSDEINEIKQRISSSREDALKPFRERIASIAAKEYPVSPKSLKLTVGKYDPEKRNFPVSIASVNPSLHLSVEGTLALPLDTAKQFKQHYGNGLVRPEVTIKTGSSKPVRVVLVNDGVKSDAFDSLLILERGEFFSISERARLIYTDTINGLQWARKGNVAEQTMTWDQAMAWVKKLHYAGYSDWRLPTKGELVSLVALGVSSPSEWLNTNGFSHVPSDKACYWTSSPDEKYDFNAWYVCVSNSAAITGRKKDKLFYIWPVRDGREKNGGMGQPLTVKGSSVDPITQAREKEALVQKSQLAGDFVSVKGGCFKMGCDDGLYEDCKDWEKPAHEVCVSDFKIGKFEVTIKQWKKVMDKEPPCGGYGDKPVECIQWKNAQEFVRKLNVMTGKNYRLPTEAEWEYACQSGGKGEKYCGSNDVDTVGWYTGRVALHPGGEKNPNGLGIYDMSGNVSEWVEDCYSRYKNANVQNPKVACKETKYEIQYPVYRGGNHKSQESDLRSYRRLFGGYEQNVGIRLVEPVSQPQ